MILIRLIRKRQSKKNRISFFFPFLELFITFFVSLQLVSSLFFMNDIRFHASWQGIYAGLFEKIWSWKLTRYDRGL